MDNLLSGTLPQTGRETKMNTTKMLRLSSVLDDLHIAEQSLRKFEQRYWLSSEIFYELYRSYAVGF